VLRLYLAVGCGTALGALLRFLVGLAAPPLLATGVVNVAGSFVIGFFAALTGPDGRLMIGSTGRQLVMSGFCGGFTTFSAMSLEAFLLLAGRRIGLAAAYLAASVLLSLAAAWLGHVLAMRVSR
jgi:CrcB protein